jgi:hypothetical protein
MTKRRLRGREWNLAFAGVATAVMLAIAGTVAAEVPRPSPDASSATATQAAQADASDKSIQRAGSDDISQWLSLPPTSDLSFWSPFDPGTGGRAPPGNTFDRSRASPSDATIPARDQLRLGNSFLGVQTEKNVQVLQSLKPNNCPDDDECAEYSGLPKPKPPKTARGNFKRQFIGLSITRPIE